jgi:hypothetical protein
MNSIFIELRRLSIARPFKSQHLEPEARVRCWWTVHPREKEAGKERVKGLD